MCDSSEEFVRVRYHGNQRSYSGHSCTSHRILYQPGMLPWELKVILGSLWHISQNLKPVRHVSMGTKGHADVIVAHLTESYTSQICYHGNQRLYTGHSGTSHRILYQSGMLTLKPKVILRSLWQISQNLIPVRYVTIGTKGNTQVIVVHLTESYTSQIYYHGNQRLYTGHSGTSHRILYQSDVTIGTKCHYTGHSGMSHRILNQSGMIAWETKVIHRS